MELVKSPGGTTAAYSTTTANDGSFAFPDVQPGEYRVLATREDGLLPAEYGQKVPNVRGLPILVHTADAVRDIRIGMAAPGAISGRIFDRDGEPVGNAKVQALKTTYWQGRRVLTIAESVQTNDVGEYRLFWLSPGQYYITTKPTDIAARSASMFIRPPGETPYHDEMGAPVVSRHVLENGEIREEVYPRAYYPGTTDFNAARTLALNAGDNLMRMDVTVAVPIAAHHVLGTVLDGSTGQPAASATLRAIPRDGGPSVVIPNGTANGNGEFNIAGLVPGSYDLFASLAAKAGQPGAPGGTAGRLPLQVGSQDLRGISIIIPPPFDLHGRLIVDGKADPDFDVTRLKVYIQHDPEVFGMPSVQVPTRPGGLDPDATQTDGSFLISGIGPGDYKVNATYTGVRGNGPAPPGLHPGTFLKSFRHGNTDVLNGGLHLSGKPDGLLEIVIGTTQAEINGAVVNGKSEAIPNAVVVLVPDLPFRRRTDLYRTAGTDASGRFAMRSIAPGGYTLFAFEDVQNGSWFDPDFLKNFESRGTRVEISQTSQENRQLIVIDAQR
ncbi:MAG TPA: carboxypeptidase-like regulatory domain-containing protein [Terriglobia bacterium]